ncbi:DNA replication and repair protein RecN [Desulfatibacillum alkenivorans DSM 16219]|jgi:DNA repair protein RecN (Recombination protein N)|uniref:DNA repair protein RecN n=1 Tax=Desulfatibacillum alkenivorans DSM 16219 TaxID=1121393 RepID=A0A1M7AZP0_9BACT|nr:DNA repair protein RecN [Desulfatibacillum alkenivorans]SHL48107.1 DNA replication and repair protein RecN [Desulfatibacillum alkenivorans DSM 16219]
MLAELSIKNFAIIDDLSVRFSDGLTAITGETGAGKSILINAVNLLLGARATPKMVRTGAKEAELEALFYVDSDSSAARFIAEQGDVPEDGLMVRRVISANNRHRVYINGRLSTMTALGEITASLASISGQHAHQGLLKEDMHLLVLDQFAGLVPLREKAEDLFNQTSEAVARLKKLEASQEQDAKERDLLYFQKDEIEKAAIQPDEDEDLEAEKKRLRNAEMLQQTLSGAVEVLYGGEGAVVDQLGMILKGMHQAADADPTLESFTAILEDKMFGLEDLASELRVHLDTIQMDDQRLEEVEDRLDFLSRLKRKYGGSLEAVEAFYRDIGKKLDKLQSASGDVQEARNLVNDLGGQLAKTVKDLSAKRAKASAGFAKAVSKELQSLGMGKTLFEVDLSFYPAPRNGDGPLCVDGHGVEASGMDRAEFMIAPNVGEELRPLKDIASGGELSRVVLALKVILAKTDAVKTVIFDEVDAGIGGAVADAVGEKLMALSSSHQVICITHLPQIARFAGRHLNIAKRVSGGRTQSMLTPLDGPARVDEIARMLAGGNITETSRQHALELLESTVN